MAKQSSPVSVPVGVYWAIGILSAAVIAFQLALIQVFSCQQWYHFAYMVISVALLGFGVAGTFLSLFEERLIQRFTVVFPGLLLLTAVTMAVVTGFSNLEAIRFDSYLLFNDPGHVWRLMATCLLFFLPFFFAALAIGMVFVRFSGEIGAVYFANLIGSGLGGLPVLWLMWRFFPEELPAVMAAAPLAAFLLFFLTGSKGGKSSVSRNKLWWAGLFAVASGLVAYSILHPPALKPSQYKAISKTMLLPETKVEFEKNTPYGLMQLVSSPVLRYAPGLSLNYRQTVPVRKVMFHNGDWLGVLLPLPDSGAAMVLDYSTRALPYRAGKPASVLVLNAGSGEDVAHALVQGTTQVAAVESNVALEALLKNELAAENDSLFYHPAVRTYPMEVRTFLLADTMRFDLAVMPAVGEFGGSSGLNALQEQYSMTLEAFQDTWRHLTPGGSLAITVWIDYPLRAPLKVLATLVEMLERDGIRQPLRHLAAVKSWGTVTFMTGKQPLNAQQLDSIRSFCRDMQFDPVLLPDLQAGERDQFNQLQDSTFYKSVDALVSGQRDTLYESYAFNIRPASDQRPYFSQFLRLKSLSRLSESFGGQSIPFLEIGYLLVLVTFAVLAAVALVLIVLPLLRFRFARSKRRWMLLYFSGIGIGYMFVEVVLIQQFLLFLGNPVYSAAIVISGLLFASGAGSYLSERVHFWGKPLLYAPLAVAAMLLLYTFLLPQVLQLATGASGWVKYLVLLAVVAPAGFLMGIPFPCGIRSLSGQQRGSIPWAWGINGYFSVISTALATIVALEWGFGWVMMLAAVAYGVAGGGSALTMAFRKSHI